MHGTTEGGKVQLGPDRDTRSPRFAGNFTRFFRINTQMADNTPSVPPRIFEHNARKDWGRSVLVQEIPDKRTFLFEDGAERAFRPDYWHKMEFVEVEGNDAFRIDKLARRNQMPAPGSGRKSAAPPKKPDITFEQQVGFFISLYPIGFEDDKYIKAERGTSDPESKLKNAAIERAEELLNQAALGGMIAAGDYKKVHEIVHQLMLTTKNTTQKAEATRFAKMEEEHHEEYALALQSLLYGEKSFALRMDRYISAINVEKGPTWPMATLISALVFPNDHIFVKPTFMKKQTLILDIDPKYETTPNATTYMRFNEACKKAKELLQVAGQRPRDLFDVYTFVSKTLSPKAIKEALGEL